MIAVFSSVFACFADGATSSVTRVARFLPFLITRKVPEMPPTSSRGGWRRCIDISSDASIRSIMPSKSVRKRSMRREERVSRTYRLPLSKLKAAQRALGAATATETIERALDLAVFQRELVNGTRAMLGVELTSPDVEP